MPNCPSCGSQLPENEQTCNSCGADTTWWIARGNDVYGPYDAATVRFILTDGRAMPSDPAVIGRDGQWSTIGQLLSDGPARVAGEAPAQSPGPAPAKAPTRYRGWSFRGWLIYAAVVFIACVAVAAAIILPAQRGTKRENAAAASLVNLKQVGAALELHAHYNGGLLPPEGAWEQTVSTYLRDPEIYRSAIGGKPQPFWYNEALSGTEFSSLRGEERLVLVAEPGALGDQTGGGSRHRPAPRPEGYGVLYTDGSVATHAPGADYGILVPSGVGSSPEAGD